MPGSTVPHRVLFPMFIAKCNPLMLHGVWQLAKQSLTLDARRVGMHATRFGLACVLYLAVIVSRWNVTVSAGGLWLFHAQLLITAFYISANAIFGFSQTIAEDKEDGSLGLMRMAGVSGLAILLGKTLSRLFDASLLLALQVPFTLVAITLGGVAMSQVYAAYVALATYLWLLAAVGVTASVICRDGGRAARTTALFVACYTLPVCLPLAARWAWPVGITLFSAYRWISLPMRLLEITESSFDGSAWCWPVAIGWIAGAVCLLGTWFLFDRVALSEPPVVKSRVRLPFTRHSRRVWLHPLVWREFYFLTGGLLGWIVRVIAHGLIVVATLTSTSEVGFGLIWAALWSAVLSLLDGTWTASRLFRDEIRDRTWSALMQTPQPLWHIAGEKVCGWALGLLPSIVCPYIDIVLTVILHEHVKDWDQRLELLTGAMLTGVGIFAYLHLLVLLSLYMGWSATPMTLTVSFAAGWLYVYCTYSGRFGPLSTSIWFVVSAFLFLGVLAVLQLLILRRLAALGATA